MTSAGNDRWSLDLDLVRAGGARVARPDTGQTGEVTWSVVAAPTKLLPLSLVECRLAGFGARVSGFGDSLLYKDSLTRAFAEAWERLWVELLRPGEDGGDAAPHSSSGFAAGATPAEAEDAARRECVERAVLLTAWRRRAGWRVTGVGGLMNRVLAAFLDARGWDVTLFSLEEARLGRVTCALGLRRDGGGALFDSAYLGRGADDAAAQAKVLRSLLAKAVVHERAPAAYRPLPERGGPLSHRDFYMDPAHRAAFDFLFEAPAAPAPLELGGYDELGSSVRVTVPGFPYVASALNPRWPRLSWGRRSILPGGNEWPHPLV